MSTVGAVAPEVEVLDGLAPLAALAPRLEALCAATGVTITGRPAWLRAAMATAGESTRPWTVIALTGDELDAAATLAIRTTDAGAMVTTARPGADDVVEFPARTQAGALAVAEAIADLVGRSDGGWRLDLPQLAIGDRVAARLLELLTDARMTPGRAVPRVVFGADRRVETYLSKSMRACLRRGWARLTAARLRTRVEVVRDAAVIASLAPRIEAIHIARDHAQRRVSDLDDPATRAFWREAVAVCAGAGTLELFLLRIEDEIAAYAVVLVDDHAYRVFDGRLTPRWRRYAPGRLLEAAVLEHALSVPRVGELDWMSSVAPDALLAVTERRPTMRLSFR